MKYTLLLVFALLFSNKLLAQKDKNGNPVFNSISTSEKAVDDWLLISNYYTLKNNIENRNSSVYVTKNPSLNQIEKAVTNLASEFFIVTKESKIIAIIRLQLGKSKEFASIHLASNKQSTYPFILKGNITENRANEIIKENYDPNAKIENGRLKFNGKEFEIISNQDIEEAVIALIRREKIDKQKVSEVILPSKEELKKYILKETNKGGELDFFTAIKGKEYDGVQIKQGVFTTKISIALYKWGNACFDIGVNTIEDAYAIYEEFKSKPINQQEKEYIKMGFYKEWE